MKNANLIIGAGVAIVLIVVLFLVLGNQGENYSMFPEFLTEPNANFAPAAAASMLSPQIAATPQIAAARPPAPSPTVNSCKSLLKVNELPTAKIGVGTYDKGTREFAKELLATPTAQIDPTIRVMITPANLKNLMSASIREAYDAGTVTGFAMTAKLGALVTKQQMKQLKVKADKTRDKELMLFAERADKLADTLSDISAKLGSRTKPVCYVSQAGNKFPIYHTIEDPNTPFGPFMGASTKILSDMNNGGDPFFFAKDLKVLGDKFRSNKC